MPPNSLDDEDDSTLVQVAWHQAITWANAEPDVCQYMLLLGHSEFRPGGWVISGQRDDFMKSKKMFLGRSYYHFDTNEWDVIENTWIKGFKLNIEYNTWT